MSISFVNASSFETNSAVTSVSVATPTGVVDDDFLVATFEINAALTMSTPSGWTNLIAPTSGTSLSYGIFYKYAASEGANQTFSSLTSDRYNVVISAFRGVHLTSPIEVAATGTTGTTTQVAFSAITPTTAGSMILAHRMASHASGVSVTSLSYSSTNLTAVDAFTNSTLTAAVNYSEGVGHFFWTSGAFTANLTTNVAVVQNRAVVGALKPAPITVDGATTATATISGGAAVTRPANGTLSSTATVTGGAGTLLTGSGTVTSTATVSGAAKVGNTYTDNFNRADGGLGANWITSGSTPLTISSNQVVTSNVCTARYAATTGSGIQFSQMTWGGALIGGVAVAISSFAQSVANTDPTFYVWRSTSGPGNPSALAMKDAAAGTYTSLVTGLPSWTVGDVVRLEWDGTTLRAFLNGVLETTFNPTTVYTGTYVGLSFAAVAVQTLGDDWSGGTLDSRPIDGSVAASATITGSSGSTLSASGTLTGTASIAGAAAVTRPIDGSVTGTATLTGAASETRPVDGTTTATATSSAVANTVQLISGTLTSTATVTGTTEVTLSVTGTSTATASVAGTARVDRMANGTLSAVSTTTDTEAVTRPSSGTVTATAAIAGSSASAVAVSGDLTSTATISGTQIDAVHVSGSFSASAGLLGVATVIHSVDGSTTATASLSAAIALAQSGSGSTSVTAGIIGSASSQQTVDGTATGTATLSGAGLLGSNGGGDRSANSAISGAARVDANTGSTSSVTAMATGTAQVTRSASGAVTITATPSADPSVATYVNGTTSVTATTSGAILKTIHVAGDLSGVAGLSGVPDKIIGVFGDLISTGDPSASASKITGAFGTLVVDTQRLGIADAFNPDVHEFVRIYSVFLEPSGWSAREVGEDIEALIDKQVWSALLENNWIAFTEPNWKASL